MPATSRLLASTAALLVSLLSCGPAASDGMEGSGRVEASDGIGPAPDGEAGVRPTVGGAPPITTRLDPARIRFVGSFRVPEGPAGGSTFSFGGAGLAFRPGPDSEGDGFPGTLFAIGKVLDAQVAEITIPAPQDSRDSATLPQAQFVQPFTDITRGRGAQVAAGEPRLGDIEYLDGALHWSLHRWYNVGPEQLAGHGWSSADFADREVHGPWTLGDYHNQLTGGVLFTAPAAWADAATGGRRLVAGLNVRQGVSSSSQGPAMFAYDDREARAGDVPTGAGLTTTPLVYYPHPGGQGSTPDPVPEGGAPLPGHLETDGWTGATWLSTGDADAVLVTGRRGSSSRYGEAQPGDCSPDKGYHGEPYRPAFLFYDPTDLAAVAAGSLQPWEVRPYAELDPRADLTPSCEWNLAGATFDAEHGLLYVIHTGADTTTSEFDPYPVVHVYRVA